jgi:hydrogenase maturation protein HypF
LNALLTAEAMNRLKTEGFHVYRHSQVPPNDGGISLGQLAIAGAATLNAMCAGEHGHPVRLESICALQSPAN